jgi:hypothetical protein
MKHDCACHHAHLRSKAFQQDWRHLWVGLNQCWQCVPPVVYRRDQRVAPIRRGE